MLTLPQPLQFQWDAGNAQKNWVKHRVTQGEAEQAFLDSRKLIFNDLRHSNQEVRHLLFGVTQDGRHLTLAFTLRQQHVRVISARDMSHKERDIYTLTQRRTYEEAA